MNTPQYCTFFIVRHGETTWNKLRILQGQTHARLNETGKSQAAARAIDFKNIEFADIFTSDLFRAKQTAKILLADRKLALKTSQLLRERRYGIYERKKISTFETELAELLEAREKLSEQEKFKHKVREDVESDAEIATRMLTFIRETAVAYPGKRVLVVSHGGIMRALLLHLGVWSYKDEHADLSRVRAFENLGYFILDSDGADLIVRQINGVKGGK